LNLYPLLIFLHVLGGVGLFAALGIEVVALRRLRSAAAPDAARVWIGLLGTPLPLLSIMTILATGIWMSIVRWGEQPWIAASFIAVAGMAVVGAVSMRRIRRLRAALANESSRELSPVFRALQGSPTLVASLSLRVAIGIGILGLMTVKPDAVGSIAILGTATAAGLIGSLPVGWRRGRPAELRQGTTPTS